MDIFDLDIEDFEKAVDKFLDSMTEEEFFEELKENGLILKDSVYNYEAVYTSDIVKHFDIHNGTSSKKHIFTNLIRKNKIKKNIELLGAA